MFRPADSVALLARHLKAARDQGVEQGCPIAQHIFEIAVRQHVPLDIVTDWIYSGTEWTSGYDFIAWLQDSQGLVPWLKGARL